MLKNKKVLVVGAGITGSTVARQLADKGYEVVVVEQKSEVGGICSDSLTPEYYVQKHGPHIFHTNNKEVWDFVSRFTTWFPYQHKVKALVNGTLVPVPFNLNSLKDTAFDNFTDVIIDLLSSKYKYGKEFILSELKSISFPDIEILTKYIENNIFKSYSLKQWGEMPSEEILNRVKAFRLSKDNRYFTDLYQGIPTGGYSTLIENILYHENIDLQLYTKFSLDNIFDSYNKVFYTGPIDELFDYKLGELPYRTCCFHTKKVKKAYTQEVATINYPNDYTFTRTHDYSHFMPRTCYSTFVTEYPGQYKEGISQERYYPIQKEENISLYEKYFDLACESYPNVQFLGRLGTYKYLNMDASVLQGLQVTSNYKQV